MNKNYSGLEDLTSRSLRRRKNKKKFIGFCGFELGIINCQILYMKLGKITLAKIRYLIYLFGEIC